MAKTKSEFIFPSLEIKRNSSTPVYRQLYDSIRNMILAGQFRSGQRLPSSRDIADRFNISRTTVLQAYEDLLSEGYIEGKTGAGTFVSSKIPEKFINTTSSKKVIKKKKFVAKKSSQLSKYLNYERADYNKFQPFKPGIPDLNNFPFVLWSKLLSNVINELSPKEFGYSSAAGFKPLRVAIANHIRVSRSVNCEPEQIIITGGSQQGIDLICRVLLERGDNVGFEDPGYPGARDIILAAGMNLIPLQMDNEGLTYQNIKKKCNLIYTTPSHQYPLGITMSLQRRLELIDFASSKNIWILEDDYDSEYRYDGHPISSLQGIDEYGCVIYMGTFSKVMFPGLRIGYLVVPDSLIDSFIAAKLLSDRNSPIFEQAALCKFISDGHFGRHLRKMRLLYEQRKKFFFDSVEEHLSPHLTLHKTETGLHTFAWLKRIRSDKKIAKHFFENGVITPALSDYSIKNKLKPGLVLGYAAYSEKQIMSSVNKMRGLLN